MKRKPRLTDQIMFEKGENEPEILFFIPNELLHQLSYEQRKAMCEELQAIVEKYETEIATTSP